MTNSDHSQAIIPTHTALMIDFDAELFYWRENYYRLPIFEGARLSDVEPAIKLALDACLRSRGGDIDAMLPELQARYLRTRGTARLSWEEAERVVRAIWSGFSVTNQRVAATRANVEEFSYGDTTPRPQRNASPDLATDAANAAFKSVSAA